MIEVAIHLFAAMMDTRIIDVHFSRTFMRLVLEQDVPLTISSVKLVDGNLGSSLAHLQSLLDKSRKLEVDDFKTDDERAHGIAELTAAVEDMTLDFTLPGYDIELKPGGSDLGVTIVNLEEYISLVIEWTMRKGVQTQLQEFKDGFSSGKSSGLADVMFRLTADHCLSSTSLPCAGLAELHAGRTRHDDRCDSRGLVC